MGASAIKISPVATPILNGNIAQNGDIVGPLDVSDMSVVAVAIAGTYAGISINFEVSLDGVTWYLANGGRTDTSAIAATVALTTNQSVAYEVTVGAFKYFRVRASAYGSGTANIAAMGSSIAYDPAPNVSATPTPTATAGYTNVFKLLAAATTNANNIKVAAATVGMVFAANLSAATKFVKLFNKASAPVPGTDTPVFNFPIPPNTSLVIALGDGFGYRFSIGLGIAITGAVADLDATAVAAGDVLVNITYV